MKAALRGSGGYSLLRRNLLSFLAESTEFKVADTATIVAERLGYELSS